MLVNVARGAIVDETALYRALSDRTIRHAVIDTWYQYPDPMAGLDNHCPPSQYPFEQLDNVTMSSHASGWTDALFKRRFAVIASVPQSAQPLLRPPAARSAVQRRG